jgi:hypothetical protein
LQIDSSGIGELFRNAPGFTRGLAIAVEPRSLVTIYTSRQSNRKLARRSPDRRRNPCQSGGCEPKISALLEDRADSYCHTEASHPGSYASMRSDSKGQMAIWATCEVEPIGIGELLRIAIRRSEQEEEQLPRSDLSVAEFQLLWNAANRHLHRGLKALKLLDSEGEQSGVIAQAGEFLRMRQ